MNEYAAQGMIGAAMAVRDKTWNERDPNQKLEALREQVTWLTYRLAEAEATIAKIRHHAHTPNGDILVRMSDIDQKIVPHELRIPISLRDDIR